MYVNESHLGGLYITEDYIEHETCEQCGDCDSVEFGFNSPKEFLKECEYEGYSVDTILGLIEEIPENEEYKRGLLQHKEQELKVIKEALGF